ncbi:hypothetical protein [Micromonospora sp. RTP1Z1]|uniref:hypothetical protein n=1 Tax=Micromonospora sp. RTP1Z1 TaxID=2994043 RepID=UPI0029C8C84D|nr:hypothetical protein [Micromonospora sp. RTP1Z1]
MERAAEALGWPGVVVPDVSLLGTHVSVVVVPDVAAHEWRLENRCAEPLLDPDSLTMWEWPEGRGLFPPSAVSIHGVLTGVGRSVRSALSGARKWRGFAATAVALPSGEAASDDLLLECSYSGIAVVCEDQDEAKVIQPGHDGRLATARRTTVDRWIEEKLYGRLLADADLADALL